MSEIRATTISDSAGTGPITLTGQQAAKMWANLNGSGTIALRDSFNTSTVTDSGTGVYDFNFTNALANDDYASPSAAGNTAGSFRCPLVHDGDVVSTTSFRIRIDNSSSTSVDAVYVHTETLGDLA